MSWSHFDDGASLGTRGSEHGVIILDDEHDNGARITLERDGGPAPFAITCGVYGCMVHTRYFGAEGEARHAFGAMKAALGELLDSQSAADSDDLSGMAAGVDAFVARFP